ncbi:MAG: ComF family protein [Elainellaceae cyanobacterium]
MKGLKLQLGNWLNIVLATQCPLCQRSAMRELCQDCQKQLQHCQLTHQQGWQGPLPVFAWGAYGGALKRTIAALKYENQPQLARPLGHWLGQAWCASDLSSTTPLLVVPIPMHSDKQRQRGFNQAELLARSFCQVAGLPMLAHGLVRSRTTEAQFHLSRAAREQNLANAFQVGKDLLHRSRNCSILLLDDIYTTGATATAAVQALQQRQLSVYGIAAVAKAEKIVT